jgi:hypothetical protein
MTTETEISTPVEVSAEVTSETVEPETSVTSTTEPEVETIPAETETEQVETTAEPKLYAGKYKTLEEFEKGHNELYGAFTKAREYENKYNDLLAKQEQEVQRLAQQKLEEAQLRGFQSVEQQEIADKVQVAEFEYYWNNLAQIDPEQAQTVQQCLQAYYQTGHRQYLDEAKRYYASDFIERVALAKNQLESKLTNEFNYKKNQEYEAQQEQLAQVLKADFADFLGDLNSNKGKELALQQFCNAGFITSPEDMKAFVDVYSQIAQFERAAQLKEIEAQKVIDATKQKAIIDAGVSVSDSQDKAPTYAEVSRMTQAEYNAAVDKWGLEKILQAK